jgi:hypothetical protein
VRAAATSRGHAVERVPDRDQVERGRRRGKVLGGGLDEADATYLRPGYGEYVRFQVDGPGFREVLMQGNG